MWVFGSAQCGLRHPIRWFVPCEKCLVPFKPHSASCWASFCFTTIALYLDIFLQYLLPERLVFDDCVILFLSPLSPLLHLLSFFSVCMTNSKEIPNCGRTQPAAPPPAFSWQDGSCLTFNRECFARQLGLGEIQWGNSWNLIWWARRRTVKPLHKDKAVTTPSR